MTPSTETGLETSLRSRVTATHTNRLSCLTSHQKTCASISRDAWGDRADSTPGPLLPSWGLSLQGSTGESQGSQELCRHDRDKNETGHPSKQHRKQLEEPLPSGLRHVV